MAQSAGTSEVSVIPESPVIQKTEIDTSLASTEYNKADFVTVTSGAERREKFKITEESEGFFANQVYDFYETFADLKDVPNGTRDRWAHDFVKTFRKTYPKLKPEEVHDKALEFVRTPQGLTFAVKISEWELAAEQGGSGGFIAASMPTDRYRQQIVAIPGENSQGSMLKPERNFIQGVVSNFTSIDLDPTGKWSRTPVEQARIDMEKRLRKQPLSEKDRGGYTSVLFRDARGNLVDDSTSPIEYNLGNLTDLQKEYLLRKGRLQRDPITGTLRSKHYEDTGPQPNGELANPSAAVLKKELRKKFEAITKARIDFYERTGRDASTIPINTIDKAGNYVDRRGQQYLKVEQKAEKNLVPDFRIELDYQMKHLMTDVKKSLSEALKKEKAEAKARAEKGQADGVVPIIEAQIKSLDESTMSPEDKQKEEEKKDADIKDAKERKEALKKLEDIDTERKTTQQQLDDIDAELDLPTIPLLDAAEVALASAQADVSKLTKNIQDRTARITAITNALSGKSLTAASQAALITEITTLNTAQSTDLGTLSTRTTDVETYTGTVKLHEQALNPGLTPEQNRENLKSKRNLESKRNRLVHQHGTVQARLLADARNVDASTGTLYSSKHFENEETRLTKEKGEVDKPNETRAHKKEVLTTFKELLGNYDDVRNRRQAFDDKANVGHDELVRKMEHHAVYYNDHPLAYVQTLQLIFGPEVAYPGSANAENFRKASNVLTPEIFLAELKKLYSTDPAITAIVDIHDPALKNPALVDKIKSTLVQSICTTLTNEASKGTLADMPPAVASQIDSLRTVVASAIPLNETEITGIRQESYYFRNTEDLTRQILDRWSLSSASNKWAVPTELQAARAYAEEIIKRKQKEVRS